MTVQRTLKKMNFSLTEKNTGKCRLAGEAGAQRMAGAGAVGVAG
jgi:hypothetical protein